MKFELISQDSRYITYRKGDRHNNICVEFDLELQHIYITEAMFIRNDTPMLEPQNEWIAHSAKYGYSQQMCPTLGTDDLEFINQKANELFGKERESE